MLPRFRICRGEAMLRPLCLHFRRGEAMLRPLRLDGGIRLVDGYNAWMGLYSNPAMPLKTFLVVLGVVVYVIACLMLTGCQAVRYPSDWPIPQLTAPIGSRTAKLPESARKDFASSSGVFNEGSQASGHYWVIAFTCDLDHKALDNYYDDQLKPLDYQVSARDVFSIDPVTQGRGWVTIYVDTACTQVIQITSNDKLCVLSILKYDRPQGKRSMWSDVKPIP
jgi:hypothetical protein